MANPDQDIIAEKLEMLVRLTAIGMCEGKGQKEQIALLSNAGMQPKAIANLLDTTPNNVSVTLSQLRKIKSRRR